MNDRLEHARGRAAEKAALSSRLDAVLRQKTDRRASLALLDEQLRGEEADVRAMEGLSLSAMFATMLGRREERLRAERADVLRATLARDACAAAIDKLRADEAGLNEQIAALGDVQSELTAALQEKESDLVARGDASARRLAEIDTLAADARCLAKEVVEAIQAADAATRALDRVAASLDSARSWGTYDLLGGGMIATWAKHSKIDDARAEAHAAQTALDRLARELADVRRGGASGPMVVEIGDFATFADYFFDGLIADWVVQERISQSRANVASVRGDVARVRARLDSQHREIRQTLTSLSEERARVVERS